jgi:hypothetical protein
MVTRLTRSAPGLFLAVVVATIAGRGTAAASTTFTVDPDTGNSAFTAVFDASLGERISAVSSAIGCTLTVDEQAFEGKAVCSVPLTSLRVDNDDTKSEHFREWATNRKSDPASCKFELEVPRVVLPPTMTEKTPTPYTTEGTFSLCGRKRDDGGPERITGTVTYLPPGSYGDARTLRIRARIEGFNRERYGVSPKNTAGWLARVQQLAPVVAAEGTIDVSIFATSPAATAGAASEGEKQP